MKSVVGIVVVTVGLIIAAAAMALLFVLLCASGNPIVAQIGLVAIPMFSGLLLVGAIYVTAKIVDFEIQRIVMPLVCLLALASVPLSAAFAGYWSRPFISSALLTIVPIAWVLTGILFSLFALIQARRIFGLVFWRPRAKGLLSRQPNQALQTTRFTRPQI